MPRLILSVVVLLALVAPSVSLARQSVPAAVESLIDDWYGEQCAAEDGRPLRLAAPGWIDASPNHTYRNTRSAALGPRYYTALAATEPLFRYEIVSVKADPRFAKVRVRERAYRYASAAGRTYERQGDTLLVLEKGDDERWRVLAHETHTTGFHPNFATVPLPDLSPGPDGQSRPVPEPRCGRYRAGEFATAAN